MLWKNSKAKTSVTKKGSGIPMVEEYPVTMPMFQNLVVQRIENTPLAVIRLKSFFWRSDKYTNRIVKGKKRTINRSSANESHFLTYGAKYVILCVVR